MKERFISIETANVGIVTIPERLFVNWFMELDKHTLKRLNIPWPRYHIVKKLIAQGQLQNTYSPVVYDFILLSLNDLRERGILKC